MSVLEKKQEKQTPLSRRQLEDFINPETNTLHPDATQRVFTSSRGRITSNGAENYIPAHIEGNDLHVYPVDSQGFRAESTVSLILKQQLIDRPYHK